MQLTRYVVFTLKKFLLTGNDVCIIDNLKIKRIKNIIFNNATMYEKDSPFLCVCVRQRVCVCMFVCV